MSFFNGVSDTCLNTHTLISTVTKHKFIIGAETAAKDETDFVSVPVFQKLLNPRNSFEQCDGCFKAQADFQGKLKRCTRCYSVAYCSRDCQHKDWDAHSNSCTKEFKMQIGLPFYVTVKKDVTYDKLEEAVRERAKFTTESVHEKEASSGEATTDNTDNAVEEKQQQAQNAENKTRMKFVIKAANKMNNNDETAVELTSDNFSIDAIIKAPCLLIEWQNLTHDDEQKQTAFVRTRKMPIHEVVDVELFSVTAQQLLQDQCSLYDCLKLFMEPERLNESESW
jgi:MYND finger.